MAQLFLEFSSVDAQPYLFTVTSPCVNFCMTRRRRPLWESIESHRTLASRSGLTFLGHFRHNSVMVESRTSRLQKSQLDPLLSSPLLSPVPYIDPQENISCCFDHQKQAHNLCASSKILAPQQGPASLSLPNRLDVILVLRRRPKLDSETVLQKPTSRRTLLNTPLFSYPSRQYA